MSTEQKSQESIDERRQRLVHKTFVMMLQVLFVFAIPGIAALFIGKWIDAQLGTKPVAVLIATAIAIAISWAIIIRMYKGLSKGFKDLDAEEKALEGDEKKE